MYKKDLKVLLDKLYLKYSKKHSSKDPVWTIHKFSDPKDIEIAGLITSCYAYGRVEQINQFTDKFFLRTGFKVHEFTSNYSEHKDKKFLKDLYYRFNNESDLSLLIKNIKNSLELYGSLENLFKQNYSDTHENILPALSEFSRTLCIHNKKDSNYGYLMPSPVNNSACKRLNLYLRWMIRKDEIDTGIWSGSFDKAKLIMPVDTHIYRVSKHLGLVSRNSCDLKFAIELTKELKKFDSSDPVKYDFALCHLGIEGEI